jgi:hypothetical protein
MGRKNNPDYSQVSVLIPSDLAKKFRIYCTTHDKLMADVVADALKEYLNKRDSATS